MRKQLLTMALIFGALTATAGVNLVVAGSGQQQSFSVGDIGKISFTESEMEIYGKGANRLGSFPLQEIAKLFFGDKSDGIAEINPDGALRFQKNGDVLKVDGLPTPTDAYVVGADGRVAMQRRQWDGDGLDVSGLPEGVYIIAVGNAAFKFIK